MEKFFNTSGYCNPEWHYMVNPLRGFESQMRQLIENRQYFLIHAPRQTGKTTLLHNLAHQLNREGKYIASVGSCENAAFPSAQVPEAMKSIAGGIYGLSKKFLTEAEMPPNPGTYSPEDDMLYHYLQDWAEQQSKPVVLLLDEVDALYDDVLTSVLRQLRNGFQSRPEHFPASIALVGLRDIREYRLKARADNPSIGSGSPFNVKTESFLLKNFSKEDVQNLLHQHTEATGQEFPPPVVDLIFEFGGGQPWLTNALAYEIVYRMLNRDYSKKITPDMVDQAKETLIARRDTHLDSLVDKLRDPRIRRIVTGIISGDQPVFDDYDDAILYARNLGIIAPDPPVRFANPIYKEITVRIMNSNFHENFNPDDVETDWYLRPDGSLDMDKLLKAFQQFYRENSESWLERFEFKEAGHQLLLMAFLQRIINGGGTIGREMAVGRGRTDVLITWKGKRFVLEMKLKTSKSALAKGKEQLARYLDRLGLPHGYLVLFETKSADEIPWEQRIAWSDEEQAGKRITVVEM